MENGVIHARAAGVNNISKKALACAGVPGEKSALASEGPSVSDRAAVVGAYASYDG